MTKRSIDITQPPSRGEEKVQFNTEFHNKNTDHEKVKQIKRNRTLRYLYIWSAVLLVLLAATGYILYKFIHRRNYSWFRRRDDDGNDGSSTVEDFDEEELGYKSIFSYPNCGARFCNAGRCNTTRVRRIVHGVESAAGAWPWMAEITIRGKHVCGGTIINRKYILTAAHCLYGRTRPIDAKDLRVIIGMHQRNLTEPSRQEHKICKSILHRRFDPETLDNDIALIKMENKITFDDHIKAACLPKRLSSDVQGIMVGWGQTAITDPLSSWLQEVYVPLVSHQQCSKSNDQIYRTVKVNARKNLCVGYGAERPDYACVGDSGGGFYQATETKTNHRWYVQGLISWVDPSCRSSLNNAYTVLTCVSCFERWIGENMDSDFNT